MSFDFYAFLDKVKSCPQQVNETGLASGFGDGCVVWSCRDDEKNNARQYYMKRAAELTAVNLKFSNGLDLDPNFTHLQDSNWFGIDVSFTLASPWYSKDDRPFHVLDNPVRKDRVFGVPFMSAASWKGLLRWACRMQAGLLDHLERHDMRMNDWNDPSWIVHLFGNEKGEDAQFRSGALACYPTWFNKLGFEVINPHSRARRAGTQPIYYEVVPAGTKGRLRLLYAPLPGEKEGDKATPDHFIDNLINSIKALLETYGVSAKRTAGWSTAKVDDGESKLWFVEGGSLNELIGAITTTSQYEPPKETFNKLMDEKSNPHSSLLDTNGKFRSKTQFKKFSGDKVCTNREFEEFKEWYDTHGDQYRGQLKANEEDTSSLQTSELPFDKLMDALKKGKVARKGGDQ